MVAGQLSDSGHDAEWAPHAGLVGAAMTRFTDIRVERFHMGMNYLLLARR